MISVATIGFTQSSAQSFFERLNAAGVKKVIDVRLHNTGQLAGFAKAGDLAFFLKRLNDVAYVHAPALAPTDDILKAFKARKDNWALYERQFLDLMAVRKIEKIFDAKDFDRACLLCSEAKPHHCHRRLVCEYLNQHWNGALSVRHL